jgi:hypothetical protein
VRRERPNLSAYFGGHEFFLGNGGAETRQIGLKVGVIVANASVLPDALLGVRVWLHAADGSWLTPERTVIDAQTPLPSNLAALHTTMVRTTSYFRFPTRPELEDGRPLPAYVGHYLPNPGRVRVELLGLNDRRHPGLLPLPAAGAPTELLRAA